MSHTIYDDFIFLGPPHSSVCKQSLFQALDTCKELGEPVSLHKCEGPDTTLKFLGNKPDTVAMKICLPQEKQIKLKSLIVFWRPRKSCTRKELEGLFGHLFHVCKVVRPGKRFLKGNVSPAI